MKKTYIQPTMKVRKIQCSHMLCGSPEYMGINQSLGEEYKDDAYAW